jgi:hypothetical protein
MKSEFENNFRNPHKQLDDVLNELLEDHYKSHIVSGLAHKFGLHDTRLMKLILQKLKKDGYVTDDKNLSDGIVINYHNTNESIVLNQETDVYYLTFEGRVFILTEGGYTQVFFLRNMLENQRIASEKYQIEQDVEAEKQRSLQTSLQKKLNRLTFWISAGTLIAAVYYLTELIRNFELYKFFCP